MSTLYVLFRVCLALAHALIRWRVWSLERRFARAASLAQSRLLEARAGTPADPLAAAREQMKLAVAALARDRAEEKYCSWQNFSEGFGNFRGRVAGFRGKLVPYVVGMIDVGWKMAALDHLGVTPADAIALVDLARAWAGV